MATIKANGGAASVWERAGHHSDETTYTLRVVLCRNGKVLTAIGPRLGSAVAALSGTAKNNGMPRCRALQRISCRESAQNHPQHDRRSAPRA